MNNELITLIKSITTKNYLLIQDIMQEENITRRQLLYRVEKLNIYLEEEKLPIIHLGNNNELLVAEKTKRNIQDLLVKYQSSRTYFFEPMERLYYMYLMLFIEHEDISLQHFIDNLQVSRSTVISDLKDLQSELQEATIKIKNNRVRGYYLEGSELNIRRFMMKKVTHLLNQDRNSIMLDIFIENYRLDIYDYPKLVIDELSKKYTIRFVEDRLKEFIYIFILLKARILNNNGEYNFIDMPVEYEVMRSLKEFEFTEELLKNYKNTKKISNFEKYYISSWILGISFGDCNENTNDCIIISDIVMKIMTRFESISGIHFDPIEDIFIQLYSHIRPAYYRLLFKIPIINLLSDKVIEEYKELYYLVQEAMKPLSALFGGDIPKEELAYLTMHFGTVYANNQIEKSEHQVNALIVCGNGIGSSAILYSELTNLFPEIHFYPPIETSNFLEVEKEVDIIFTTSYFTKMIETALPIVKVTPVMSIDERYQVVREVDMILGNSTINNQDIDKLIQIIRKHCIIENEQGLYRNLISHFALLHNTPMIERKELRLIDLVEEDIITLNVEANNREEAIRKAYIPMLNKRMVEPTYVEEIIKNMHRLGPYIVVTKHVALPHAKPEDGANKTAIGICALKNPIVFGNKENDPVKYLFCLSSIDGTTHLQAMSDLVTLLGNNDFYEVIDNAKHANEVYNYIKDIENQ